MLDEKTSKRILEGAKRQQQELEEEFGISSDSEFPPLTGGSQDAPEEEEEDEDDGKSGLEGLKGYDEDGQKLMDDWKISEDDEAALNLFMRKKKEPTIGLKGSMAGVKIHNLGEFIAQKIRQKEMEINDHLSEVGSVKIQKLDPKVEALFKGVKQVMSHYRSGKIPKPFKVIPTLSNWEQVLYLTEPESWTAAALYAATRIFASNMNDKMAQRFFNLILLPRVRDDISTYKKLNFHLYQALRKALYKPGAFFKGIILPLVEEGDCSLREAVIISSVLAKHSVPMLHSAAALLKIAEMEYSGASSVFIHVLLSKKYALPYRVIDGLVAHMVRFETDKRSLPVLWHQAVLVFAQNYASDMGSEQRDALLSLIRIQTHWQVTPVIRNVLSRTKPRDVEEGDFIPQEKE